MRAARPAARILLVDAQDRVLMFRFTPDDRPPLWCTPGGAVDPGESYAAAARRELWEEVGLDIDCGPEVAQRTIDFMTFDGVEVTADEVARRQLEWYAARPDVLDVVLERAREAAGSLGVALPDRRPPGPDVLAV